MAKRRTCTIHKIGDTWHAGGGPIGFFRITKVKWDTGYHIEWTGGATRRAFSKKWVPTLARAKEIVCYWIRNK